MHKNFTFISFFFVCVACALFITANVHSAGLKEQMAARIPAINALKDQGIVGENNSGFLEYRTESRQQEQLITEENRDRNTVYTAIAQKEGATVAIVGKRRAQMIVERGNPGHWFQKEDGSWYKK